MLKTKKGFNELDLTTLDKNYQASNRRLIMIEFDGVLPTKAGPYGRQEPLPEVIEALDFISKDKRNKVFIISSKSKQVLHQWFA